MPGEHGTLTGAAYQYGPPLPEVARLTLATPGLHLRLRYDPVRARTALLLQQLLPWLTPEERVPSPADFLRLLPPELDDEAPTLQQRVLASRLPPAVQQNVLQRLARHPDPHTGEGGKLASWVEALLAVPLGLYASPPAQSAWAETLQQARAQLDAVCHGQARAKGALLERLFQWLLYPPNRQRPLALVGPPGTAKTTLLRAGASAALQRPVRVVGLGAATDANYLLGHGYTYEGSQPGRLVECLCDAGVMNPVVLFDELDKVSGTPRGDEIHHVLLHVTDPAQADAFRDRYLHGLDIDLSACLFFFTMNDTASVPATLLDRLEIVHMEPLSSTDLRHVVLHHLLPTVAKECGLQEPVLPEASLAYLCALAGRDGCRAARQLLGAAAVRLRALECGCADEVLPPACATQFQRADNTWGLELAALKALATQLPETPGWSRIYT